MKKLIIIALLSLNLGCVVINYPPRDFSLGCHTDSECEDEDDMAAEDYQKELEDLQYFAETGKVRL